MAVYVIRRVDQQKMEMKGGRAMMIQALFRCTCTQVLDCGPNLPMYPTCSEGEVTLFHFKGK